jgi:hypothetical protein
MLEPMQRFSLTAPTVTELEAILAELTLDDLLAEDEPYDELRIET